MSQQQQPPANTGAFIGGVVAGLFAGGTGLTLIVFLVGLAIAVLFDPKHNGSAIVADIFSYAIAAAVAALGIFFVRRNVGFLSGFVLGVAAGLLGGISVCSGITSGLNNMH